MCCGILHCGRKFNKDLLHDLSCCESMSRFFHKKALKKLCGVLITDHNVRDTLEIIDRAYIIHDGMVLMEGSPSDIVGNADVRRVYLGDRFNL